jgi:hypothetical protein
VKNKFKNLLLNFQVNEFSWYLLSAPSFWTVCLCAHYYLQTKQPILLIMGFVMSFIVGFAINHALQIVHRKRIIRLIINSELKKYKIPTIVEKKPPNLRIVKRRDG